jgi:HEAT repeat protein
MKNLICLYLAVGIIAFAGARTGPSQETKNEAVQEGKSLKEWTQGLFDPDPEVRRMAQEAIGKLGPNAGPAVPALIQSLKDKDYLERSRICVTLTSIGKPAVPALLALFKNKDTDRSIRVSLVTAIGSIGSEAKEAIPDLIEALKDPEPSIVRGSSSALANMGQVAIPSLIKALKEEDETIRAGAAQALGKIGPEAEGRKPRNRCLPSWRH